MTVFRALALSTSVAAASMLVPAAAGASTRTIDFEGVSPGAEIADFYAAGGDGAGLIGPDLGVSFAGGAVAYPGDVTTPLFANAPSPGKVMVAEQPMATLNYAPGFVERLGFDYSALGNAHEVVTIYGGLDRTGPVLGRISLADNAQLDGCTEAALCHWQRLELSFAGTARSIDFGGNAGKVAYDNITITPIPEPGTYALLTMGMLGLLSVSKRARKG